MQVICWPVNDSIKLRNIFFGSFGLPSSSVFVWAGWEPLVVSLIASYLKKFGWLSLEWDLQSKNVWTAIVGMGLSGPYPWLHLLLLQASGSTHLPLVFLLSWPSPSHSLLLGWRREADLLTYLLSFRNPSGFYAILATFYTRTVSIDSPVSSFPEMGLMVDYLPVLSHLWKSWIWLQIVSHP